MSNISKLGLSKLSKGQLVNYAWELQRTIERRDAWNENQKERYARVSEDAMRQISFREKVGSELDDIRGRLLRLEDESLLKKSTESSGNGI